MCPLCQIIVFEWKSGQKIYIWKYSSFSPFYLFYDNSFVDHSCVWAWPLVTIYGVIGPTLSISICWLVVTIISTGSCVNTVIFPSLLCVRTNWLWLVIVIIGLDILVYVCIAWIDVRIGYKWLVVVRGGVIGCRRWIRPVYSDVIRTVVRICIWGCASRPASTKGIRKGKG